MIKVGDLVGGKYRVTRILGEGGMGLVVQAYHDLLETHVAIKFMRLSMVATSGGAERFLREARALVKLKSQHAVKVHDLGVHDQMPYIVMEHLAGSDMQSMLDNDGPMHPADAARYIRQACEAIAEAHSLGIYHRDLKPANLFLAQGPSGRIVVKVLDFGIAKMIQSVDDKVPLKTSLTGTNTLMGTLPYMSPEQLLSPKDIDARADIWSLGVVLYELVTGDLPFQGHDMYQMQQAIRYQPCSMKGVPLSLQPVLQKCLEKKPADRYASAVELAMALRPIMNESLSPFGDGPVVKERRSGAGAAKPVAVDLSLPGTEFPLQSESVDGSAKHIEAMASTLRAASLQNPERTPLPLPVVDDGPNSDDEATLRVEPKYLGKGTIVMAHETPEPPTVKRLPSDRPNAAAKNTLPSPGTPQKPPKFEGANPHIVPVRRNVLAVNNKVQLSRRQRRISRGGRLVIGALVICAVAVGINACRKRFANVSLFHPTQQSVDVAHRESL